jgi:hypothetical protein
MLKNYAQGEGSSKKSVLLLKVGFLNIRVFFGELGILTLVSDARPGCYCSGEGSTIR